MMDLRPIIYIVGRILSVMAILMLAPALIDWRLDNGNAGSFLQSAIIVGVLGLSLSFATSNSVGRPLDARQAYLLTALIWGFVPLSGALPFMLGAPFLGLTDAYFEAVSGITTTGASVITGLEELPAGMNLWRGMLNWLGGLGIAFIAMIFLPVMRIGGMQFFRTEGFDTFGKILPRATDIARQLLIVYALLTLACILTYAGLGMIALDAVVNGLATIATGGFSSSDASFAKYEGAPEYAGALFMFLGSLPYIRFVQLVNGSARPLLRDWQVQSYALWLLGAVLLVTLWRLASAGGSFEPTFRAALFNLTSIMSSTGFSSQDFASWGGFALIIAFVVGVIGACSGSSAAGLSVFRVQISMAALRQQIRLIVRPSMVTVLRYEGRRIDRDVTDAVASYVTGFIVILGLMTVGMTLVGVELESSVFAVWTSLANIGYGFGPAVQATGTFVDFPDGAKWIMILAMILGRLGLLAILVLVLPRFWLR